MEIIICVLNTANIDLLLLPKIVRFMRIIYLFLLLIFTACSSDTDKGFNNIEEIKKNFIATILTESSLDEGPFQMNYHLRAILFSDNVVSLMGDVFVFAHLPHGWIRYEGKTYVKTNDSFKEITLNDLFSLPSQKEFLRSYCENFFKHDNIVFLGSHRNLL
jgi:uncharacterized membrane protein YjdF